MDFDKFKNCTFNTRTSSSRAIFAQIKHAMADELISLVYSEKKLNRGPKPDPQIALNVLEAIFEQLDNGSKLHYLETHHHISRGTYYRYLKLILKYNLFEKYNELLLKQYCPPNSLIADATHIRSLFGSECVDFGYKEHGKKAIKLTVLINPGKVIYLKGIHPDNLPDHIALKDIATSNCITDTIAIDVLADAAYNGKEFKQVVKNSGYNVISPPKKRSKAPPLSEREKNLLKTHRVVVEHTFSHLKTKRALQIKTPRNIWVYGILVSLACLINNIYFGIVKSGLVKKSIIKLTKK